MGAANGKLIVAENGNAQGEAVSIRW